MLADMNDDSGPPVVDYASPRPEREDATDPASLVAVWSAAAMVPACLLGAVIDEAALLVIFFLGVIALVAGLVGVWRTMPKRRVRVETLLPARRGRGAAWVGLLAGAAVLGVAVLLPMMGRARVSPQQIKCASNLRQIGQAVRLYAIDGDGTYPPDFDVLLAESDLHSDVFLCPNFEGDGATPPPVVFGGNSTYRYLGRGLTDAAPASRVLAFEDPAHHGGEWVNVLFADGSVEFLTVGELIDALARAAG